MARVMTTSSGLWFCKATKPAPVFGVSCEAGDRMCSTVVRILVSFRWLVSRKCRLKGKIEVVLAARI